MTTKSVSVTTGFESERVSRSSELSAGVGDAVVKIL